MAIYDENLAYNTATQTYAGLIPNAIYDENAIYDSDYLTYEGTLFTTSNGSINLVATGTTISPVPAQVYGAGRPYAKPARTKVKPEPLNEIPVVITETKLEPLEIFQVQGLKVLGIILKATCLINPTFEIDPIERLRLFIVEDEAELLLML